jgi:hypothetical protein
MKFSIVYPLFLSGVPTISPTAFAANFLLTLHTGILDLPSWRRSPPQSPHLTKLIPTPELLAERTGATGRILSSELGRLGVIGPCDCDRDSECGFRSVPERR